MPSPLRISALSACSSGTWPGGYCARCAVCSALCWHKSLSSCAQGGGGDLGSSSLRLRRTNTRTNHHTPATLASSSSGTPGPVPASPDPVDPACWQPLRTPTAKDSTTTMTAAPVGCAPPLQPQLQRQLQASPLPTPPPQASPDEPPRPCLLVSRSEVPARRHRSAARHKRAPPDTRRPCGTRQAQPSRRRRHRLPSPSLPPRPTARRRRPDPTLRAQCSAWRRRGLSRE